MRAEPWAPPLGPPADERPDKFRLRYTLMFLAAPLLVQVYGISKGPEDPILLSAFIFVTYSLGLVIYFLIVVLRSVYMRHWKRLVSMLVAPVLTLGLWWGESYTGITPNYIKFSLSRSGYLSQIQQSRDGGVSFHAWLWDRSYGVGVTQTRAVLIYDESDQILLPPEARSADWVERVSKFEPDARLDLRTISDPTPYSLRRDTPLINKLAKHFYLVTEAR